MDGICLRGKPGWGDLGAAFITVLNTFGGTWWAANDDGSIGASQVDQPEFAEALSCKCRVIRHMSFEDALIRRFVDPDLIRRLGIRDTESLQNGMISRRIRSAQRRVESLTVTNIPADSAEEWFQANCPDMKPVVN